MTIVSIGFIEMFTEVVQCWKTQKETQKAMQSSHKSLVATVVLLFAAAAIYAQTSPATTPKAKKASTKAAVITAEDVKELRDALAAQQQQIQELRDEMRG